MAETDEIIQIHGANSEGNKYPTTLAEAVLMEKNGDKTIVDALKETGGSSIPTPGMVLFTGAASKTSAKLKMQGPENVTVQTSTGANAVLCKIGGFKVLRKTGGYPTGPDDSEATLVINVPFSDNKKYANTPYEDTGLARTTTYYYAAYVYSDNNKYNTNPAKLKLITRDYTGD